METTRELLAAVKKKHGITSDYALGKLLDIPKQTMSNYAHGHTMGDDHAIKVADDLGLDRGAVLVVMNLERAKSEVARAVWAEQLKRLGGLAAGVLMLVGGGALPSPAQAGSSAGPLSPPVYYVKRRKHPGPGWIDAILRLLQGPLHA